MFIQNFIVAQTPANPALVLVTDTSTGTDNLIVARRITILDSNGNYIVPAGTTTNYIDWPLNENPITLNILNEDMALNVKVDWLYAANVVQFSQNQNYCFTEYNKQFLYYLIQLQSLTYNVIQDNNYWGNVGTFWVNIISAINSVQIADDIFSSQVCLNRATYMAQNQGNFF